jgi:hypothetical protein
MFVEHSAAGLVNPFDLGQQDAIICRRWGRFSGARISAEAKGKKEAISRLEQKRNLRDENKHSTTLFIQHLIAHRTLLVPEGE